MMRLRHSVPLICAMLLGVTTAKSEVTELPSVAASSIVLVNSGGIPISFNIRPQDGEWSYLKMQPGDNMMYSCKECSTPAFEFIMRTGEKQVQYKLIPAKRYSIKWNKAKDLWDIFEVN